MSERPRPRISSAERGGLHCPRFRTWTMILPSLSSIRTVTSVSRSACSIAFAAASWVARMTSSHISSGTPTSPSQVARSRRNPQAETDRGVVTLRGAPWLLYALSATEQTIQRLSRSFNVVCSGSRRFRHRFTLSINRLRACGRGRFHAASSRCGSCSSSPGSHVSSPRGTPQRAVESTSSALGTTVQPAPQEG